jgi:S1-C subfamily serine protease
MTNETNTLAAVSDGLAAAVERAAKSTVLVDARARIPASGVVWSTDGLVVTADHVIEREEQIAVRLGGEQAHVAELVGRDPGSDLALLRVSGVDLAAAERAPEGSAKVGHVVLAVGRPSGAGAQASIGVVSAVGGRWRSRSGLEVDGYLRTDTTFFPGFSGGPLIDVHGRVLGINSSRFRPAQGITIPSAAVAKVVEMLAQGGRIRRAYLGVGTQVVRLPGALAEKLGGRETGLLIMTTEPESPADRAGLYVGDIILAIEGQPVSDPDDLLSQLGSERVGATVTVGVLRGGELRDLRATLAERE